MADDAIVSANDTPAPNQYKEVDMDRYKNRVIKVSVSKSTTHRQDKIKKNETIDFYENDRAHKFACQQSVKWTLSKSDRGLNSAGT